MAVQTVKWLTSDPLASIDELRAQPSTIYVLSFSQTLNGTELETKIGQRVVFQPSSKTTNHYANFTERNMFAYLAVRREFGPCDEIRVTLHKGK